MFQPGDYVVYGSNGLCRVEQVGVPDFDTFERGKTYYFLRAVSDESRIYAPTDTHQPLRAPATREEALALLKSLPAMQITRPAARDRKGTMAYYQQLMHMPTCENLAAVLKSMRFGRLSGAEEALHKKAENHLCTELANALDCPYEEALAQLTAALRPTES